LVEDEYYIRMTVAVMLRDMGYVVREAGNGLEALEALDGDGPFDLLVTDIVMPVMNGMELIDNLRERDVSIPVLALSGLSDEFLLEELSRRGCYDFLRKPVMFEELRSRIANILNGM
jgi:two-component system cell cycle sensor histidine kinase/response regulator CckA